VSDHLPSEVVAALELLMRHFAVPAADADPWIDAAKAPLPQRAIRDAVRRGELVGHRVAHRLLVRRSELDRYIEAHRVVPEARAIATGNVRTLLGSGRRIA